MNEITAVIKDFIAQNILFSDNGYPYANDDSFLEKNVIDSMGVMELVLFSEETFGIKIEDEEIIPENLDSVSKLARLIALKQQK